MRWPFTVRDEAAPAGPSAPAAAPTRARWDFPEGFEIAPGRHVLRRLGGGSRYEVHLVWDEPMFALLVAKLLRPDVVASPRALRELAREAALVERLAHPSLVRGFGAVLGGPRPHLLLEHVEGPTLRHLVARSGSLSLDQLLPLGLQLLAVLHHLASRGAVHLDVKPGNVIVGTSPKLIDLSVARSVDDAARLRRPIGTDGYMAPEQCAPGAAAPVGPAADVFGAGATLYEAAAGRPPFPRASGDAASAAPAVRFPQLRATPPAMPGGLPPPLGRLLAAMLARDPADRPTAREAAEALEPLVAEVPERLVRARRGGLVAPR